MAIKNIIFDLGGVILDINYQLTEQAFGKLGVSRFMQDFLQNPAYRFFIDFETGKITSQQFREALRDCLKLTVSDEILDNAWNALLLTISIEKIKLLRALKRDYRTFLFSNTNAIHINAVFASAERQHQLKAFNELFEKAYYSHLMGTRKPEPAGFLTILQENDLVAEETLFVDDLYVNIQGAKKLGLNALHINESCNLLTILHLLEDPALLR